jgi:hypothetical protein
MNDTDREQRERILKMLSEGTLRPDEAAKLLAALAPAEEAAAKKPEPAKKEEKEPAQKEEKAKQQMMEVQMQRPDGSNYTVELPPSLVPMIMKMAGVAIRESARTASKEAWDGFKTMVRNKADEVKDTVKEKVARPAGKTTPQAAPAPEEDPQFEARRRILQMVQNGRITAQDASRLIQELDALRDYQKGTTEK